MKHNICGNVYYVWPGNFLSGSRCPICINPNYNRSTISFRREIYNLVSNEYIAVGEYINSRTKTEMQHNSCGNIFKVLPGNFLRGTRCPHCRYSKGEKAVLDYLNSENISYESEYTFEDLQHKGLLRYDFYIPKYNLLIEYDGKQHYEPRDFAGKGQEWAEEEFKATQYRDSLKNAYAKDNDINLLRIPYWDLDKVDFLISETIKGLEV